MLLGRCRGHNQQQRCCRDMRVVLQCTCVCTGWRPLLSHPTRHSSSSSTAAFAWPPRHAACLVAPNPHPARCLCMAAADAPRRASSPLPHRDQYNKTQDALTAKIVEAQQVLKKSDVLYDYRVKISQVRKCVCGWLIDWLVGWSVGCNSCAVCVQQGGGGGLLGRGMSPRGRSIRRAAEGWWWWWGRTATEAISVCARASRLPWGFGKGTRGGWGRLWRSHRQAVGCPSAHAAWPGMLPS